MGGTAPLPPLYTPLVILKMMSALNVRIKAGTPYSHNFNPIERFHRTLWSLLKAKKANGDNNWEKVYPLPTLILVYNATLHYSTLCRPTFRQGDKSAFNENLTPPPLQPHTLDEALDHIIDLMRQNDHFCNFLLKY